MSMVKYPNWEAARRVLYSEFEREVRKYEPHHLLALLARMSASMEEFSGFRDEWRTIPPWTISGIARQAIVSSSRSSDRSIDERGLVRIANLYPRIEVVPNERFEIHPFLSRAAFEQFPYQLSGKEDLSRTLAVLLDTSVEFNRKKTQIDLDDLLGAPVADLATSTFVLYGVAKANGGAVTRTQIEAIADTGLKGLPPARSILATLDRLSATIPEARVDALSAEQFKGGYQKYSYNPLTKTPFIRITDELFIAPQTFFILRSCSLENFYYLGMKQWPKDFGSDLGHRIEAYTGRQLKHSGELEVHPEVTWKGKKSIDWFVVTPAATILIECKSARAAWDSRIGATTTAASMSEKLRIAYEQLSKTFNELRDGNPAFSHIPIDRPIIGLVVTAEPIYNANFAEVRRLLPDPALPILALSLRDLEGIVTLPASILGETLLKVTRDSTLSTWDIFGSVRHLIGEASEGRQNTLIDESYARHVMPVPDNWDAYASEART